MRGCRTCCCLSAARSAEAAWRRSCRWRTGRPARPRPRCPAGAGRACSRGPSPCRAPARRLRRLQCPQPAPPSPPRQLPPRQPAFQQPRPRWAPKQRPLLPGPPGTQRLRPRPRRQRPPRPPPLPRPPSPCPSPSRARGRAPVPGSHAGACLRPALTSWHETLRLLKNARFCTVLHGFALQNAFLLVRT